MPLYGYSCSACAERFDVLKKMGDPDPVACPRCGGGVRKELSAPHFRLSGSGWYETDFKGPGEHRRHLAESPPPSRPRP